MIRKGELPARNFLCVYSTEQNKDAHELIENQDVAHQINGSVAHMTAIFGFTIAGEIIKFLFGSYSKET